MCVCSSVWGGWCLYVSICPLREAGVKSLAGKIARPGARPWPAELPDRRRCARSSSLTQRGQEVSAETGVWAVGKLYRGHWAPKLSHHVASLLPCCSYHPAGQGHPHPGPEIWVQSLLQGLASRVTVTPSAFCPRLSPLIS